MLSAGLRRKHTSVGYQQFRAKCMDVATQIMKPYFKQENWPAGLLQPSLWFMQSVVEDIQARQKPRFALGKRICLQQLCCLVQVFRRIDLHAHVTGYHHPHRHAIF